MEKEQFIHDALCLPTNAIDYHVSQHLAEYFPERALVEGEDGLFNIEDYAKGGHCTIEHKSVVHNQVITHWYGREPGMQSLMRPGIRISGPFRMAALTTEAEAQEISDHSKNAWFTIEWRGHTFDAIFMRWAEQYRQVYHYWVLAESKEIAKEFIKEVCRWNAELRGEVLVYEGGCWHKDARLFQAIQGTTFDNLILRGSLKQEIYEDLESFFSARETYETYGIPWKRGILFVGPPGNGKTHAVKAIINALHQRCLYVKSFRAEHSTDEDNIRAVFERARKSAPCMLVLEDLDALLTAHNRSFFLNELDGFAANIGIVTLATTNHPERLDPAILDRPSRFDRKYPFDLPEQAERLAYIKMWNDSLKPALRVSEEGASRLAELTEGFSFAYLKELFLSSMMRWITQTSQGTMEEMMTDQVGTLHEQMISASKQASEVVEADREAGMMVRRVPRTIYFG